MPTDWPLKTIAECAAEEPYSTQIGPFGNALKASQYVESGVPVLRGVNVNRGRFHDSDFVFVDSTTADRLAKFESFPGDVLLVHKGTLGEIGLMPTRRRYTRYIMGNSMMRVRCDPQKLLPEYLYYWLSSANGQHYLLSHVSQVGVPQIQTPLSTLRQARLPVPPVIEQRSITHILSTLDEKIDLNRRRSETLEALAHALFQSWFVDFEPVRGKAEGRHIGITDDIADLFSDSLIVSTLGEVPANWRVASLDDVAELNPESWTKATRPDCLDYVDLSSTKWGRIESVARFSRHLAPSRAQRVLRPGDTVVGTVRPANGSYALISEEGLTGSTAFAVLRPRSREVTEFVYLAATRRENIETLARLADGGAYPAIRPALVANTQCVIPTDGILRVFSDCTRPMFDRIAHGERESRTLAALRDTLLPKLISGELRIKDAERIVSEVV